MDLLLFGAISLVVIGGIYVVLHRLLGFKPRVLSRRSSQAGVGSSFHGTGYGFGPGSGGGDAGGGGGDGGGS
jgi:hypothetical protein